MGVKTITEITCDWCGKKGGPDDTLGFGTWTYVKEETRTQRNSVACSDKCRIQLNALWKVMIRDRMDGGKVRLYMPVPSDFGGEMESRILAFELDPFILTIDDFRKLTLTGTIQDSVVLNGW